MAEQEKPPEKVSFQEMLQDKTKLSHFLESTKFTLYILCVVLVDFSLFLIEGNTHVPSYGKILMTIVGGFIVLFFILEMVLKLRALGGLKYFESNMNTIDMMITLVTTLGYVLENMGQSSAKNLTQMATFIRFVRMARLSRLLTTAIKTAIALSKNNLKEIMHRAMMVDDWEKIEDCLVAGINPNDIMLNESKMSYLMHAAKDSNKSTVSLLLNFGADVHQTRESDMRETAIYFAVKRNRPDITSILLAAGAYVNDTLFDSGWSLLHEAVGKTDILCLLLSQKAATGAQDFLGQTPLHIAVKRQHVPSAEALLSNGAPTETTDIWGQTPKDYIDHSNFKLFELFQSDFEVVRRGSIMRLARHERSMRRALERLDSNQGSLKLRRRASIFATEDSSLSASSTSESSGSSESSAASADRPILRKPQSKKSQRRESMQRFFSYKMKRLRSAKIRAKGGATAESSQTMGGTVGVVQDGSSSSGDDDAADSAAAADHGVANVGAADNGATNDSRVDDSVSAQDDRSTSGHNADSPNRMVFNYSVGQGGTNSAGSSPPLSHATLESRNTSRSRISARSRTSRSTTRSSARKHAKPETSTAANELQ